MTGLGAADIEAYLVARSEDDILERSEWPGARIPPGIPSRLYGITEEPIRSPDGGRLSLAKANLVPEAEMRKGESPDHHNKGQGKYQRPALLADKCIRRRQSPSLPCQRACERVSEIFRVSEAVLRGEREGF